MRSQPNDRELHILKTGRVARMATADRTGEPHIVPVCYVFDEGCLFTPIDSKPKRVSYEKLKRVKNISANPKISILLDRYSEDWKELYYILITGTADLLPYGHSRKRAVELLTAKYSQYKEMGLGDLRLPVIRITPVNIVSWGNL